MTTKTKQFDVTCIDPTWNNREVTHRSISHDRLFQNDSGETRFKLNHFYTDVEVVSVVEVSQDYLDAQLTYFTKYGTANE
jgi:hypothetical protein